MRDLSAFLHGVLPFLFLCHDLEGHHGHRLELLGLPSPSLSSS